MTSANRIFNFIFSIKIRFSHFRSNWFVVIGESSNFQRRLWAKTNFDCFNFDIVDKQCDQMVRHFLYGHFQQ